MKRCFSTAVDAGKMKARTMQRLTQQNAMGELRQHFYRATVVKDYKFREYTPEEEVERQKEITWIDKEEPYQEFFFDELPCTLDEAENEKKLLPCFDEFCKNGEEWMGKTDRNLKDLKRAVYAIEDYLILRRA